LKYAQICSKHALKYTIFVNIHKRPNNGQIILFLANSFKKGPLITTGGTGGRTTKAEEAFPYKI